MNKKILSASLLAAGIRVALAADPAALSVVVFDEGRPVPRTEVWIDGSVAGRTDRDGSVVLRVPAGSRELILRSDGRDVLRLELQFTEGERAELIASLRGDVQAEVQYESSEADRPVAVETESAVPAGPPGTVAGRVVSSEGAAPVANARVFISGTALDVRTDADGRFSVELPPGSYSLSVIAANYDTRSFDGIAVESGQTLSRQIEITPAGIELPEFVVLEPFVEGSLASLVEERRESASVADFLGAEQISRAGDSDAAGALKRVTGLTLVGGKYVYVRGLGERYSSVLINGAQLPSPDPNRRVVPLDLFPTEVLDSVAIQKTYSGDLPAEFGGGTIVLRTRSTPPGLFAKIGGSMGYADGTTGTTGLIGPSGSRDWSGYDRGARALPQSIRDVTERAGFVRPGNPPSGTSNEDRAQIARDLASKGYSLRDKRIGPDTGLTLGFGNRWTFLDDLELGVLSAFRYSSKWDRREEVRQSYASSDQGLQPTDRIELEATERSIELSGYFSAGLRWTEDHQLTATSVLTRLTDSTAVLEEGDEQNQILRRYRVNWVENELLTHQLGGEHRLPWLGAMEIDWDFTRATADRYAPNNLSYIYDRDFAIDDFALSNRQNPTHTYEQLEDVLTQRDLKFRLPLAWLDDRLHTDVGAGLSRVSRERVSDSRTYSLVVRGVNVPAAVRARPLDEWVQDYISASGYRATESTFATQNYNAEQQIKAHYLFVDAAWVDRYRLNFGLRREQNFQELTPFDVQRNQTVEDSRALIDERRNLPFANATWKTSADSQLRFGYSETVSRPDFRELSEASFVDPELDTLTQGNPDLLSTDIRNYDLRWEYYFSPSESFSAALFRKTFTNPIEKGRVASGSGSFGNFFNAQGAKVSGVEFDVYKRLGFIGHWRWTDGWLGWINWDDLYVASNYARIRSSIVLAESGTGACVPNGGFLTSCDRPLQGQSPYVFNAQIGYIHPDGKRDYTLLFNRFGERIAAAGVARAGDIYEQPFNQLDFVFAQQIGSDWSFKVRLRNLLDPKASFTQEGLPTREFKRGRELQLALEWKL